MKVAPGQTITLLAGTPLESTITVADGTQDIGDHSAKATADGVSLHLLKGISVPTGASSLSTLATGPGAVVLELAHAEAAVNGQPAVKNPTVNPSPPPAPPVKALAFTGTSPWLPIGGMVLVGAALGTRRLRRRVA